MTIKEIKEGVEETFDSFHTTFADTEYDSYDSYAVDQIIDVLEEYFSLLMEKISD